MFSPKLTRAGLLMACLLGMLTPVAAQVAPLANQTWKTYTNHRFGISTDIPVLGFQQLPAPHNNDGRSWASQPALITISVYGAYWNVLVHDFNTYRTIRRQFLTQDGATVTYEPSGDNWFVLSGYQDGVIYYLKVVTATGCNTAAHLLVKYPESERALMDDLLPLMANSITISAASTCE